MFVFDISAKKEWKLPPIGAWLAPRYNGPISDFSSTPEATLPQNWKKDFPEYVFAYPKLQEFKVQLNTAKQKIDLVHTQGAVDKYDQITDIIRVHDELRGKRGVLVREYNAEIVTNAWLKMFELMTVVSPVLDKVAKSSNKQFNSFHFAEAPGNFMLAINHYIHTTYPSIEWSWLANSYRDLYVKNDEVPYFTDQYGLMAKYPQRWIYGADGDGDITSPANIRSFAQVVHEKFGGVVQLMTSDVKYVPPVINYDDEENINLPVHLGHMLCAIVTLSKGGTMILKQFTLFEAPSIALLFLMSQCFKQLMIIKPETSRPANSEVYIVGREYKKNLTPVQLDRLIDVMQYIRFLNTFAGSPCLFKQDAIPQGFVDLIIAAETKLVQSQLEHLVRNMELFKKYEHEPLQKARADMSVMRKKQADAWIKRTDIKVLNRQFHMKN